MASSQVFVSSIFTFLFLLPQTTSSAVICKTSSCGGSELNPPIKFPYRLKGTNNDQSCGCQGFDLSCNNQRQTILTLPNSGDVVVECIDYYKQSIYITDPDHCFARRFLDNFTLSGSPFQFLAVDNFTFLNCSANVTMMYGPYPQDIPCVSGDAYTIWITPSTNGTGISMTPPPSCRVISVALLPVSQFPTPLVQLTWGEPSCGECVADDGYCARRNATTLDVVCFQDLSAPSSNGTFSRIGSCSYYLSNYFYQLEKKSNYFYGSTLNLMVYMVLTLTHLLKVRKKVYITLKLPP
jgi:hypothetical protein